MKVVILAGGLGTRLSEETTLKPKPMVEIGGKPILWHIMNMYASYNFKEFVVACGYKSEVIKDYFLNFYAFNNDLTIQLSNGAVMVHHQHTVDWTVRLVDTGHLTQTGGRIKRLQNAIGHEPFMLTYGDGVSNVDLLSLAAFHKQHGKLATVTVARPPSRFGGVTIDNEGRVAEFKEKPQAGEGWINAGFFVLEPGIFEYIESDESIWERAPMEKLALDGQLMGFCHEGFWQPMDTLREKQLLENMWQTGKAPWKMWES